MANAANILNNTILIPYHDSLTGSGKGLPANKTAENLEKTSDPEWEVGNSVDLYIKKADGSAIKMVSVQGFAEFGMSRENNVVYSGGNQEYAINLPGPVNYNDVTIMHLFSRDKFFLDWIKNGVLKSGVSRADIEVHINAKDKQGKHMVFTLYDAFPINWSLISILTTTSEGELLFENITITYSKASFSLSA